MVFNVNPGVILLIPLGNNIEGCRVLSRGSLNNFNKPEIGIY